MSYKTNSNHQGIKKNTLFDKFKRKIEI